MECLICGGRLEDRGNSSYLYDDKCEIRGKYFCSHCGKAFDRFLTYVLKLIDEEWRFHSDFKVEIKD